MKFETFEPSVIEQKILAFWDENNIVGSLRERNKEGQPFYFLEGPPYTSGRVHIGTAWQTSMKDIVLRYKRAQGLNVWDRMGYDMHGLPTEQKVMNKFDLKNKDDIEKFGVKKFTEECEKFCTDMMVQMNKDFQRLGITLDFSDPYQPITRKFMEAEWWLIKRAHEKNRLYQGLRTMHWDAATASSVAKHELEYKSVTDTALFVKFKRKIGADSFFIIWTTTPWTIPLNLAIMVNPNLDYVEVDVALDDGNERWIVAKELLESVLQKAKIERHTILSEFKGAELEGEGYEHPLGTFDLLPEELQENPKLFSVLLTDEYVDSSAGTGLVHSAPGCGPEDYEIGHLNGIPPFNCVNEEGFFENFGDMSGWEAKTDDVKFIKLIHSSGALVAKEKYTHDYPYGERSHKPVIFRTTKQWFFKVEDLKEKMLAANEEINWNPKAAKNAFRSWLDNLRDNSITKQRYWGTPVPIWQAADNDYIVIGSLKELEELSHQKVENMHIPGIDSVTITQNGKEYTRIPDVLDVWIDAGTASWNCLNYPSSTHDFEKFFPADFILEGKDQIRGWFNLLMVASFLAFDTPSFKNVYMNGFVTDVHGEKMSKSLGNIISPDELIEKHGADVLRYYMFQTSAGEDINFSWDECRVKERQLNIFWNVHKLLLNLAKENEVNPFELTLEDVSEYLGLEEKYILSRLNSTIEKVTSLFEEYKLDLLIEPIQELFLDLSRTYIQLVREKSSQGTIEEKKVCLYTIGQVFLESMKMFQTIAPFICEAMYLNLREEFNVPEESISHYAWPQVESSLINLDLEEKFTIFDDVLVSSLHAREKAARGVRWPLREVVVVTVDTEIENAILSLKSILASQLNVKEVKVLSSMPDVQLRLKVDYKKVGPIFGPLTQQIITHVATLDAQKIVTSFEKDGEFLTTLDGSEITILPDHVVVERMPPAGFVSVSGKGAQIYLATQVTSELESEGFSREVARKVQSLRKDAGLEKNDRITLTINCSEKLKEMLVSYAETIKAKVGAESLEISYQNEQGSFSHSVTFKVKAEEFTISFDVL